MPILNYTTEINVHQTVGEIQAILAKAGALAVSVDYDKGQPVGLIFVVQVLGRPVNFRLPSRHEGVLKALKENPKVPTSLKTEAQARRVAWRILKDWVAAQMAIIEAGQAELPEVFLPYAVANSGMTVYEEFKKSPRLLSGGEE